MNGDSGQTNQTNSAAAYAQAELNDPLTSPIWKSPMDAAPSRRVSFYIRLILAMVRKRVISISGDVMELHPSRQPRIFVFNHSQRIEAVLAPALLSFCRRGRLVHFMADWQFLMVPIVRDVYRSGESIIVTTKSAKPKFLNVFKPKKEQPAFERAVDLLKSGSSVGLFPEAVINRDPNNLLRGMPGAAKMALLTGADVLPIGIRFPEVTGDQPIPDNARMSFHLGRPLRPPTTGDAPDTAAIREFHAVMMTALEQLSGKTWRPDASRRRKYVV